jgi:putative endonuclease
LIADAPRDLTSDLVTRATQHRSGEIPGFTADHKTKRRVWYEPFGPMTEAIHHEKQFKK